MKFKNTVDHANELLAEKVVLEARMKELEALNNHFDLAVRKAEGVSEALRRRAEAAESNYANEREARKKVQRKYTLLEAELARLKAQEPIGKVVLGDYDDCGNYADAKVVCLHDQADWEHFQDGFTLYAEPRPAVLPEDDEDGNPAGFIAWYERKFYYAPFKGTGHISDCDAAYRAGMALGCQQQRFVVKLPDYVDDLHGVGPVISLDSAIEAIKAANGEIAE